VILLGGTVRTSAFGAAIKRSRLDLPIGGGATLLTYWVSEVSELGNQLGLPKITARVVIGRNCFAPQGLPSGNGLDWGLERDPVEFRGTGGVLSDLAREYDDHDLLLVINANQLCVEPLSTLVQRLMAGAGDVRLLAGSHRIGDEAYHEPAGLQMLKCGCLRDIASNGFVDLKEQALPAIAARHSVRVVGGSESVGHSIRRWNDYLAALRRRHDPHGRQQESSYAEDWQPLFSLIESGATVDATARVHDSVVLAGARVDAKATVVRSLIAPGGVVRRGSVVIDRLVTPEGESD
jgi:hypothetical protein